MTERQLQERIIIGKIRERAVYFSKIGRDPWDAGSIRDTGEHSGLYARLPKAGQKEVAAWTDGFVTGLKVYSL